MTLNHLSDQNILLQTKALVKKERELLTTILHHLSEIQKRKLFSDLGYQSLFEYAVKELKYSEGQAGRRLQALRLIQEIPEVENQVASGELSLSNISQAQSYFRESKKHNKELAVREKKILLKKLENKSYREAQEVILELKPDKALPKEQIRVLSKNHRELSFVMDTCLESKLSEIRSLLKPHEMDMSLASLINLLADQSLLYLKEKRFGKKRIRAAQTAQTKITNNHCVESIKAKALNNKNRRVKTLNNRNQKLKFLSHKNQRLEPLNNKKLRLEVSDIKTMRTENQEIKSHGIKNQSLGSQIIKIPEPHIQLFNRQDFKSTPAPESLKNPRYLPREIKYHIWKRDSGKCVQCKSQKYLQFDHMKPVALGGETKEDNLRLLCFNCNQRSAIKLGLIKEI